MFIVSTVRLYPDKTVLYRSLSGRHAGQPTFMGTEANSTLLRGHLLAVLQGFQRIEDLFGTSGQRPVDILVEDPEIAELIEKKNSVKGILSGADDALWEEIIKRKAQFRVRVVSSIFASEALKTILAWSCMPPQRADLPNEHLA